MTFQRAPAPELGPVNVRLRVDDRTAGHTTVSVFVGRQENALGHAGSLTLRNDELEELIATDQLVMDAGPGIRFVPAGLLRDGPVVRHLRGQLRLLVEWAAEAILALEAATVIGERSLPPGDHLHYANHDRLVSRGRVLLYGSEEVPQ